MFPKSPHLHPWSTYRAALLVAVLTLFLFWLTTYLAYAQSTPAQTHHSQVDLTQARLFIDGHLLLEQTGVHLSKPAYSPDGRWLAVTIVPLGAETADLAQTLLYATNSGALQERLAGHTPVWQADNHLQLWRANRTLRYMLTTERLQLVADETRTGVEATTAALPPVTGAATYPATIRVAHHPSNGCRDVPAWQVDVIPFEEYVARVVPAESPANWPVAALAAQAVAARTYGWRQILAGRADYDVTDWANFQMMCDDRYPSSDSAATLTAGQYLTSQDDSNGVPISAMYSAENGHPTLTNPNVTYLQAVPDLFALGRTRNGHGYGLSQWGAYRRAVAGQSYRQILGHYYTAVDLQSATGTPVAAIIRIDPPYQLGLDALRLQTIHPPALTPYLWITATAGLPQPFTVDSVATVWRAPQPLAEGSTVTAQLWLSGTLQDQLAWTVDHTPPAAPSMPVPATVSEVQPTFQMSAAADHTPLLRSDWIWEGETLHHTANSGALLNDTAATGGTAWQAQAGVHSRGVWYGPYTKRLSAGHNYRALFWLRAGVDGATFTAAQPIARLDVTDEEGDIQLGLRDLWLSDFADGATYQPIAVDFHLFAEPTGIELRVAWAGTVDLALDRVEVWRLADAAQGTGLGTTAMTFDWSLRGQVGTQPFVAAQMDGAGNLSALTSQLVQVVDPLPPYFRPAPATATWLATAPLTRTAVVSDSFSGLDFATVQARIEGEGLAQDVPVTLDEQVESWQAQSLIAQLPTLADGSYVLTFSVHDRAGNQASTEQVLLLDRIAPVAAITTTGTFTVGWYTGPATVTLAATDERSGLAGITYQLDQANHQSYTAPWLVTSAGVHTVTAWATDQAGNRSAPVTKTVGLDLAAPVASLRQSPVTPQLVRVTWQASDDASGVSGVEMAVQQGDGPWLPLALGQAARSSGAVEVAVAAEVQTQVRLRARDTVGRVGEWTTLTLWVATDWVYLPVISR